jgi:hypothetical protein
MRRLISTAALALTAALFTSAAAAQIMNADRTTLITFSAPVSVPGMTLPAGTYTFKLLDSQTNRNVVQIFDKDREKIYATLIAIPAQRDEVTNESVVTFKESPASAPPAIRYWYYASERGGQEFAYPKKQAMLIANASRESVLSVDTDSSNIADMKGADVGRVQPGVNAEQQAARPSPSAARPAQPAEPRAASPAPAPDAPAPAPERPVGTSGRMSPQAAPATPQPAPPAARPEQLPRTASVIPLVGLIGLGALGGAIALRLFRRATA